MNKEQIIKLIFDMTNSKEAQAKLKNNWYYMRFIGLDLRFNQLKYSMACNISRFSKYEYINTLNEIKKALAN